MCFFFVLCISFSFFPFFFVLSMFSIAVLFLLLFLVEFFSHSIICVFFFSCFVFSTSSFEGVVFFFHA